MANDREGRPVSRPPGKRPSGKLSQEERALWEHTARTLEPIKGKKQRVHAALEDADTPSSVAKREAATPPP